MALFIQQNDNRTKLQEQLAAELRAKAKARAELETTLPDGVEDSNYLKDTKATTSLAWVWIAVVIFVFGVTIFLIISSSR